MSLKPFKKSDLEKGWMKKRRDRKIRIQPEYHLIVTEGTKTEPKYFQAIRDIINSQFYSLTTFYHINSFQFPFYTTHRTVHLIAILGKPAS